MEERDRTPLHDAVLSGLAERIRLLLDHEAKITKLHLEHDCEMEVVFAFLREHELWN